jgi:predicted DNA-binding transcriptional regulator AlpA
MDDKLAEDRKAATKPVVLDAAMAAIRLIRDTEAAAILGCSRATFWKLVAKGTVPNAIKLGGMSRWRLSDIDAAITMAVPAAPVPIVRKRVRRAA